MSTVSVTGTREEIFAEARRRGASFVITVTADEGWVIIEKDLIVLSPGMYLAFNLVQPVIASGISVERVT